VARAKPAPKTLGEAGKALWRAILADLPNNWQLDARELHVLERACQCADDLVVLDAAVERDGATVKGSRGQPTVHPALSEARQLRLVQLRLLSTLEMSDPQEAIRNATPAQSRARKAAEARWAGHTRRAEHG
jgi:P27 family predicted phage terminase small subunit